MEDVGKKMTLMREALRGKALTTIDKLIQSINHPFTAEVMAHPLLDKFKPPQIEMFDSGKDPLDHLEAYKTHMSLQVASVASDEVMCRAFSTTIKGLAKVWFSQLKAGSISNFTELSRQFIEPFY